ncbi:MAG: 30S ribosomal protein S24e [archaeon]
MEIEILNKEKNPLLGREGIEAKVAYSEATPSRKQIRKELAKKIGKKEELVVVRQIKTYFGSGMAKIYANAYDKEEDLKAGEIESILKRHEKGKKGEEAPPKEANEPKPEAKEEKKEEKAE